MKLPIRKKALIQTERLTLKPYEVKDVEALADLLMNQEIGKTFMVTDLAKACFRWELSSTV